MLDTSLIIMVVILALVFDFINGFHDTANAIATCVSTRAIRPGVAIVGTAILNFLGAMISTGVAKTIGGDIVISLDTVRSNAEQFGKTYEDELHRVIIHGILHLCGINDKGPGEREIMEAHENEALAMLKSQS